MRTSPVLTLAFTMSKSTSSPAVRDAAAQAGTHLRIFRRPTWGSASSLEIKHIVLYDHSNLKNMYACDCIFTHTYIYVCIIFIYFILHLGNTLYLMIDEPSWNQPGIVLDDQTWIQIINPLSIYLVYYCLLVTRNSLGSKIKPCGLICWRAQLQSTRSLHTW